MHPNLKTKLGGEVIVGIRPEDLEDALLLGNISFEDIIFYLNSISKNAKEKENYVKLLDIRNQLSENPKKYSKEEKNEIEQ